MALLNYEFRNLDELFLQQLKDVYDAEYRLVDALPKMAEAASSNDLRNAFQAHEAQTKQHVQRLEQVFDRLGKSPERDTCAAMKGLIDEGQDMIKAKGDDKVRDAGLIAAAQRVEHYEIASYGTLRTFAQQLGMSDVANILQTTLDEEGETDKRLTSIAESHINMEAQA